MPIGSFDISVGTLAVAAPATAAVVYRYTPGSPTPFGLLPNVRCLGIHAREGPEPPVARFCYILGDALAASFGWPGQFQDVWPMDAQGPYCVQNDDRLVVADQNPDGTLRILFDGFAQIPQVDVSPQQQSVSFTAVNVAIRCFDIPVSGRTQRDSTLPGISDESGNSDLPTDLPTRFNPADHTIGSLGGFLPNCTPEQYDSNPNKAGAYPVFCDPMEPWGSLMPILAPSFWTVGKAIRYLLARYNAAQQWVQTPPLATIDQAVYDYSPAPGFETMNPGNLDSYTTAPVTIRDYDATNKPWPRVVADLLAYAGFYMQWVTTSGPTGLPLTQMAIYRRDEFSTSPLKWVYLGDGTTVANSANNATGIRLARDSTAIVNAWQAETAQRQVEISIVLLPLYRPGLGDDEAPACNRYAIANWTPTTEISTRRMYRWYGADELGEGHLGINPDGTTAFRFNPCEFVDITGDNPVFPPDQNGNPTFTQRYRPGHNTLISTDSAGRPLKATLQIVLPRGPGQQGPAPLDPVVIAAGDWPNILQSFAVYDIPSGWELLPDRLGIQVTADDPMQWMTGNKIGDGTSPALSHINGIAWWCNPTAGDSQDLNFGKIPVLILTVTIDDDYMMDVTANPRFASPTQFPRWRAVDGRDHFKYTTVGTSSYYYAQMGGNGQDPVVVRDDTEVAQAHVNQLRSKHEFPPVSGTITIPYITTYYNVGDQIMQVSGRGAFLQTNVGAQQGEQATYPWVVGVSWGFENDRQTTTLTLSDKQVDAANAW